MLTQGRRVLTSSLTAALISLLLLLGVPMPRVTHAQAICPLPARLQAGDAVEVIAGAANRLRYGPGLGYGKMAINVQPGDVWYVQSGPVCADGINWYHVAAYDAAGWTAEGEPGSGYYLGRTSRLPREGGELSCISRRLSVGMVVAVSDGVRQRVHAKARKNSPLVTWLYPDVPVTITRGPVCADGWVWWYVSGNGGRLQGWTAEGDGPKVWLAPAVETKGTGAWTGNNPTAAPTFVGTARVSPAGQNSAIFSPDQQAFSMFYGDFIVQTTDSRSSVGRRASIVLPVRSGAKGYRATATLGATVHCDAGSQVEVTFQVGSVTKSLSCAGTRDGYLTVDVAQPANADLPLYITAHAQRQRPGAYAVATIDLIDLSIRPR